MVVEYPRPRGEPVRAVAEVSFDIRPAEILGLVGESGSGKSTVGMVVAGFLRACSGRLVIDGSTTEDWTSATTSGRGGVQMIFQDSSTALDLRFTVAACVGEALAGGGRIRRRHLDEAQTYLERVGLDPELGRRKPRELSGGQKQRVAIARALAAHPRLLVCDESVSALDVSVRAKILNLLIKIRREEGIAILFISHDLAVVSQLVDRVVVMRRGRVVETGDVDDVISSPTHPYTQALLAAVPRLEHGLSDAAQPTPPALGRSGLPPEEVLP
nr:ATP-binding cassette domain-containing protein [Nocardioides albus]